MIQLEIGATAARPSMHVAWIMREYLIPDAFHSTQKVDIGNIASKYDASFYQFLMLNSF